MTYESESEAFHKSRKLIEQERLERDFKPTDFPPSLSASPAKGAPAFLFFQRSQTNFRATTEYGGQENSYTRRRTK